MVRRLTLAPPPFGGLSPVRLCTDFNPYPSPPSIPLEDIVDILQLNLGKVQDCNSCFSGQSKGKACSSPVQCTGSPTVFFSDNWAPTYVEAVKTAPILQDCGVLAEQRNFTPRQRNQRLRFLKNRQIKENRCFRCCEKGHKAPFCRNARVCSNCNQIGHLAPHCSKLKPQIPFSSSSPSNPKLKPSSASPSSPMANPPIQPVLTQIHETDQTKALELELGRSVVLQGDDQISISEVMAGVRGYFPFGVPWNVRKLPHNKYQVEGTVEWKEKVLSEGTVRIGLRTLQIVRDDKDLDPRSPVTRVWVRIFGVPYGWWAWPAIKQIVTFGDVFDIDKATATRKDLRWARVQVEVKHPNVIPSEYSFEMLRDNGKKELVNLRYVVEDDDMLLKDPPLSWNLSEYAKACEKWTKISKIIMPSMQFLRVLNMLKVMHLTLSTPQVRRHLSVQAPLQILSIWVLASLTLIQASPTLVFPPLTLASLSPSPAQIPVFLILVSTQLSHLFKLLPTISPV